MPNLFLRKLVYISGQLIFCRQLVIILSITATLLVSCAHILVNKTINAESNSKIIREMLGKSNLTFPQDMSNSDQIKLTNYIEKHFGPVGVDLKEIELELKNESCILEKGFWRKPSTFFSILSFTLIPISNEYLCSSSLKKVDSKIKHESTFLFESRVMVSYGVLMVFMGLEEQAEVDTFRADAILSLLSEAAREN